jgi:micrococcal nuclease
MTIALIITILVGVTSLYFSQRTVAQSSHDVYLPLIVKYHNSATPPTPTEEPSATPTVEPSPTLTPTEEPSATPTETPVPDVCKSDPQPDHWDDYPITIRKVDKVAETVELENVSNLVVSLDGWSMCSFRGGQHHPISGTLEPEQIKGFPNTGRNIWNNSAEDNGGLYNRDGKLVSYWRDN